MNRFWAAVKKDIYILKSDLVGFLFMLVMPIVMAIIVTIIQNAAYNLLSSKHSIPIEIYNGDTGSKGDEFISTIKSTSLFHLFEIPEWTTINDAVWSTRKKTMVKLKIDSNYSTFLNNRSQVVSIKALSKLGLDVDTVGVIPNLDFPIVVIFHPEMQETIRTSVMSMLSGLLHTIESKSVIDEVFKNLGYPDGSTDLGIDLSSSKPLMKTETNPRNQNYLPINATQHNIPAWTIFAMFFIVISLGSSIVREKQSGSYLRLKTIPTPFWYILVAKQFTYLIITQIQTIILFTIGIWIFPYFGLPPLQIPDDILGLVIVSIICGLSAVSFAVFLGTSSRSQEQVNGIGAVSIVVLAMVGGLLVPSFAMPQSFNFFMNMSPLHWCLDSYYGLFLHNNLLSDILPKLLPLGIIVLLLQGIAILNLKRQQLI